MVDIINFYNIVNEELRFERNSRKIELLTTTTALNQQIEEQSYILDLGAGTGAYSFYYAQQGHHCKH